MMTKFKAVILAVGLISCPLAMVAQQAADQPQTANVVPADQQPTKEQLAKLFELMRVKQQMTQMSQALPAMMQQQMGEQIRQMQKDNPALGSLNEDQQKRLQGVMAKFTGQAMGLYTGDEMIADMSSLYQKHLNKTDVDGIIAFYSSPAGQHMIEMIPVITKEFMPMVMQKTQERMRPLVLEMSKEMAEIAKSPTPAATEKPAQK